MGHTIEGPATRRGQENGPRVRGAEWVSHLRQQHAPARVVSASRTVGHPKAGLHAFRHSRVTILGRTAGLRTYESSGSGIQACGLDRHSHTHQEPEYRRRAASKVGLDLIVGPNGPKSAEEISHVNAA